jgi:predicted dehydrogenase
MLGNVEVSRNATYGYDIRTEVLGTDGVARVSGSIGTDAAKPFALVVGDGEAGDDAYLTERFGEAYRAQIHHFVECVRENREPSVTGADAQAAFEIGLAATYSARTGEPVALADVRAGWTPDQAIL